MIRLEDLRRFTQNMPGDMQVGVLTGSGGVADDVDGRLLKLAFRLPRERNPNLVAARHVGKLEPIPPPIRNFLCDVAFSVEGPWDSFEDIPPSELLAGMRRRLSSLENNWDDAAEAFGFCDSYDVET